MKKGFKKALWPVCSNSWVGGFVFWCHEQVINSTSSIINLNVDLLLHILRYVNYSSNQALISIFSVCGCGTIKVTLSQKAQTTITLPNLQGLYEESATVNGRSSWISTNKLYAIWYHPDFKDWMMGLSKEIGTRWLVHFFIGFIKIK